MNRSRDKLARLVGIQESYTDIWGQQHGVSGRTKEAILAAMGVDSKPDYPEIHVIKADTACECVVYGKTIALPALPMGYHEWLVDGRNATLISAPSRCWLPPELADGKRIWGVSTQLYGLRSSGNWGMGDFSDLAQLAEKTARMGADILGVNPLHASYPSDPQQFSPYAPSNREFLNYLYIDVAQLAGSEVDAAQLEALQSAPLVAYIGIAACKKSALEKCFLHFWQQGDFAFFEAFKQQQGVALQQQAVFDALSEHFSDAGWYGEWPEAYQRHTSPDVQAFSRDHRERVEFYSWLQYVSDQQLAYAQDHARASGMLLGLYRDLAVGSSTGGAETWLNPTRFVRGVTVGAPPDSYNIKGQNWGLPPFNPLVMRQESMQPLIQLLRANMRHAGALRIDHAFGLSRQFWVPQDMPPTEGAYVSYPFEAMLAVLRVESHRNQCLVIGEDLGTFPPGYKEQAAASGVLSYRLLYFEREADGSFIQPENYPALALASVSTHDLPTLAGWRAGLDIDLREQLNLYPQLDMAKSDRTDRQRDRKQLDEAMALQNLDGDVAESAQLYLARSPAILVMVQLEDVLEMQEQANLPSTIDEHPNWRRKLPVPLEAIGAEDSPLAQLAQKLNKERQRQSPAHPLTTYRLQLHKDFTFYDAATIIPYLKQLGVSHVYTSPITQARLGSTHGYDVTDYTQFNNELGGEKGFMAFRTALEEHGMRHLLDFVPNHMGIDPTNHWWQNVLALGAKSPYARYFDIDWREKLLLPVLGKPYDDVLAAGELDIVEENGQFWLRYFDHRFALHPGHATKAEQARKNPNVLATLIDQQCYRLAYWREAARRLNYRRFFEINDLAGIRVEDPEACESVHALIFDLMDKGKLDALRIDHIDGLADPAGYCRMLQQRIGPNRYIVAEKILGEQEGLPTDWPIAGTSGYEALNHINGLFVQPEHEAAFSRIYQNFTGDMQDFASVLHMAKRHVLNESFGSELHSLAREAARIANTDYTIEQFQAALLEIIVCFPVYRSYATSTGMSEQDYRYIQHSLEVASMKPAMRQCIRHVFAAQDAIFLRRFQQLTGPAMAKGLEDTSFYRYHRFISLNEVGGNPGSFGMSAEIFHTLNRQRAKCWPQSMIATATHDTKRGEDMRARLNALSTLPDAWEKAVNGWKQRCALPIHAKDAYFLYQTFVGSWPLELLDAPLEKEALDAYQKRLCAYIVKALREGKERSAWLSPDTHYEQAMQDSIGQLLASQDFLASFLPFARRIAALGMQNSLCQIALKLTLPGVPDIYQGTEFWDFSLVDPDNRKAVDYLARSKQLATSHSWDTLLHHWQDGRIKQQLITTLLAHREQNRALYAYGDYVPLTVKGTKADTVLAYARCFEAHCIMVVLQRFPSDICSWQNITLLLPDGETRGFRDIVHKKNATTSGYELIVDEQIPLPVAIYENHPE